MDLRRSPIFLEEAFEFFEAPVGRGAFTRASFGRFLAFFAQRDGHRALHPQVS